jgi:FKBP-type peptidyl-prolyl cis-trans isomerase
MSLRTRAGVLALFLVASCTQIGLQQRPTPVHHEAASTTSGLKFQDLFIGLGPAARPGDQVTFEYTAWLEDGTRIDSTSDRGVAITVTLGQAPLKAWDEGLIGIQPQGRRRLIVPPELAYGSKGVAGMVPPNAVLVIEVLAIEVGRSDAKSKG